MKDLQTFLHQEYELLSGSDDDLFVQYHESFCSSLGARAAGDFDLLNREERGLWAERFRFLQRRYLALRESETVQQILASCTFPEQRKVSGQYALQETMLAGFGRNSYNRVEDLARMLQGSSPRHCVMVGCGALPATLFWLHDHFPEMSSVALDVAGDSLELAGRLSRHLGVVNIRFEKLDGKDYDYHAADLVYVANQVTPKKEILERIGFTAGHALTVVVRDPSGPGWLLAEEVASDLPPGFTFLGEGPASPAFHSKDLFLHFQPNGGS